VLWSQLVFVPSMLLGGLMLPYSMLPEAAGKVAQLLPATHAMNAFNGLSMGSAADFSPWGSVIVLALSGLLAFALAGFLFSWDSRNTTRRGHPLMAFLALLPFAVGIFMFYGFTGKGAPKRSLIGIKLSAFIPLPAQPTKYYLVKFQRGEVR